MSNESGEHDSRPSFSVVIPVFNDPIGLLRAVDSVLEQSLADFELIVVDDGSTLPVDLHLNDSRLRLIRLERSSGPGAARNKGIAASRGRYVAFLDSDDAFGPHRLRNAAAAHQLGFDAVVCNGTKNRAAGTATIAINIRDYTHGFTPQLGRVSIARSQCIAFDETFFACQDIDWWLRLPATLTTCEIASRDHQFIGTGHERVLNSPSARLSHSYRLMERHPDVYRAGRPRSFRLLRIAMMERRQGSTALALNATISALRSDHSIATFKQALRIWISRPEFVAVSIDDRPLPPVPRLRAIQYRPLVLGSAETRLRFVSRRDKVLSAFAWVTHLTGLRDTAGGAIHISQRQAICAYGIAFSDSGGSQRTAPYVKEPLETELFARLIQRGSIFVDIGAGSGWYSLVASRRVGPEGRVLAFEFDDEHLRSLEALVEVNKIGERVAVRRMTLTRLQQPTTREDGFCAFGTPDAPEPKDMIENESMALEPADCWKLCPERPISVVKVSVDRDGLSILRSLIRSRPSRRQPPTYVVSGDVVHGNPANHDGMAAAHELMVAEGYLTFVVDYLSGGLVPFIVDSIVPLSMGMIVAIPASESKQMIRMVHGG